MGWEAWRGRRGSSVMRDSATMTGVQTRCWTRPCGLTNGVRQQGGSGGEGRAGQRSARGSPRAPTQLERAPGLAFSQRWAARVHCKSALHSTLRDMTRLARAGPWGDYACSVTHAACRLHRLERLRPICASLLPDTLSFTDT